MNFSLKANTAIDSYSIPKGVYMAGYGDRNQGNIGTHDKLYTKAITIEQGGEKIILIGNDLYGVDKELVKDVTVAINKETSIPEENIFICATHTHAAPDIFDWEYDKRYFKARANREVRKHIIDTMIKNAIASTRNLVPVKLEFGQERCNAVASNRIDKDGPLDDLLNGVFLLRGDDTPLAIIINYPCHPTVLGADNKYISADYPGVLQRLMEEHFEFKTTCIFMNGACGNQSTRYTREGQGFSEVKRIGKLLFTATLKAYEYRKTIYDPVIQSVKKPIKLPKKQLPSRKEALEYYKTMQEELKIAKDTADLPPTKLRDVLTRKQGAAITLKLIDVLDQLDLNAFIQLVRLGDIALVGMPVEIFNDYGFLIKEQSPYASTLIVGYANGKLGYVYTPESYDQRNYEAWASPFARNIGDFLVEKTTRLLEKTIF